MRSIWKGSISFGLVSIPIKVMGATESHSVSFRQLHTTDGGRIRYRKVCELDGAEVPTGEIGKGYEAGDGSVVQLSDQELEDLPLPTARSVEILGFVPVDSVPLIQLDRSYYLAADAGADKPYVLLRQAMERSGKGAIAKLAMRGRETLALLRPWEGGVLAMHTMLWPDEIRSPSGLAPDAGITVRDKELDLADTLMDSLGSVDVEELHDEYRTAVETLVSAKLSGEAVEHPAEAAPAGRVVDLMAALEDSVRAAKEARGEEGEAASVTSLKEAAAKKRPSAPAGRKTAQGRKAPAKRSGAKKAATKKSADAKSAKGQAAGRKTPAKKAAPRKRAS